jgi:hypothetical protein
LPIAAFWFLWLGGTIDRYWTFGVRFDARPIKMELLQIGAMEAGQLLHRAVLEVVGNGGRSGVGPEDLRLISLFVSEGDLAELDRNLPHSAMQERPGKIWHRGRPLPCKVRYRGDFAYHWAYDKKSWRVKTKRSELWEGMHRFNLVVPKFNEQVNNFVGYQLAREMGLIAPRCELVQVAVNGKLRGVHLLVEQPGELMLRRSGYMPGDLYTGETIGRDSWVGVQRDSVFEHPEVWGKAAINNRYELDANAPLRALTRLVREYPTEASQRELSRLIDLEAFARLSVFEAVTQSFHFDEVHNWRLFYDANRRRFVPVVWDPATLIVIWRPENPGDTRIDVLPSRLHSVLFQNGAFLRARHAAMVEFFAKGMGNRFLEIFDRTNARALQAIKNDPYRHPVDIEEIGVHSISLRTSLRYAVADVARNCLGPTGEVRYRVIDGGVAVEVSGRRPVSRLRISLREAPRPGSSVRVRYNVDGRDYETDVSGACTVSGAALIVDAGLLPQLLPHMRSGGSRTQNLELACRPAYYEVVFGEAGVRPDVREILCERGGAPEPAKYTPKGVPRRTLHAMFGLVESCPHASVKSFSGDVDVRINQEIGAAVTIAPGTTFHMHPGASIRFAGRVTALGTADRPIRFVPRRPAQEPWGAVVVEGRAASGSQFQHCEFARGSGWKEPLFEYSAMFSLHDVKSVVVNECRFRDSQIVDDMVHAVYAGVEFRACEFDGALMDALDMDISTGKILDCVFRRSGNDALDLMTSRVVVQGTKISDSRDKGISVGEDTTLFVADTEFTRCATGVEVKDGSKASIYTSRFRSCVLDVNAYKKNWRYGDGGHIEVHNCQFLGMTRGIRADRVSSITVRDSFLDKKLASTPRIRIDPSNDFAGDPWKQKSRNGKPHPLPRSMSGITELARPHLQSVDFTRRGPR